LSLINFQNGLSLPFNNSNINSIKENFTENNSIKKLIYINIDKNYIIDKNNIQYVKKINNSIENNALLEKK
jgi:hypothetical protein